MRLGAVAVALGCSRCLLLVLSVVVANAAVWRCSSCAAGRSLFVSLCVVRRRCCLLVAVVDVLVLMFVVGCSESSCVDVCRNYCRWLFDVVVA